MFDEEMKEYILKTYGDLNQKDIPDGLILWDSEANMIDQVAGEDCQGYDYDSGRVHRNRGCGSFFSSSEDLSVLSFSYLPVEFLE